MPLEALYRADKAIARFPGWTGPEPETGYLWFDAPLEIGGVVEAGLSLRGGAVAHLADQHVMFQLIASKPGVLRRIPLTRIEWRSIRGGHSNPRKGNSEWRGKRVPATHLHDFELNWLEKEGRMRGQNLPIARPVEEDIQSFESLREYTGKVFGISNIGVVFMPPWEYSLFDHG